MRTALVDRAGLKAQAAALLPRLTVPSRLEDGARRAASYVTTAANYVENRRRFRAGREDLRPLYFIWTVSRKCNFLCTYCDDHRGRKYPELPKEGELDTDDALDLLGVMRTRSPSVYFAGGEPTLRNDLPQLLREARRLRYYPTIINTNGSAIVKRLHQPGWSTVLADLDLVVVSLDSLDIDELKEMWKYNRPGEVIEALHVLSALKDKMRFKLMVNCVIQPGRIAHARAVLDFARDLDITFSPTPVNIGPKIDGALQDDPEYSALVDTILERKREGQPIAGSYRMLSRLLTSEPLTCRNTLKPHVDHDGELFWPCKTSVDVEPMTLQVRDFDDLDDLYAAASKEIDPRGFSERCGAECNWAQNYSTDAYAHGLLHPSSLLADVRDFLS